MKPLPTLLLVLALTPAVAADDWPQWLGPNRDAVWAETGILDRLNRGAHREDDELVHPPMVLGRDPVVGIEQPESAIAARHLPRHPRRQIGDIEGLDRTDPRFARQEAAPHLIEPDAERRHEPHAGDDDAPHAGPNPAGLATVASNNTISYAPR